VVFLKTKETFGGLSNMAGGFPLEVNGIPIRTSEALYQACRFPHLPEVQKLIISQKSPMTAKMKGKPHRRNSRPDWDRVRVKVMRWCLRVKLAQNWSRFSRLLLKTGDRPIVEESRRDSFWGAKPINRETLTGMNVLGRLLMELREEARSLSYASSVRVEPIDICDFLLYGYQINPVEGYGFSDDQLIAPPELSKPASKLPDKPVQAPLFDQQPPFLEAQSWHREAEQTEKAVADLRPYTALRDPKVEWLGEVPEHWKVLPNRALFREVKNRNCPDEQMLSVTIKRGVIRQATFLEDGSKKDGSNQDRSNYKLVQPGDIAYNKMRAWQGSVGVSNYRGIVSPAYVIMRSREGNVPRYFHYLFRTPHFAKEAECWSYGITSDMWSLRPEHFKMIYTPQPPIDEQAAIVRFLDHTSRRLNRAIRAKQKLIALLNEQKQVIIHRAVTRGLDSDVPLKPSGVPWLGDIPEHWEIRRFRTLVHRIDQGISPLAEGFLAEGPSWGVLKAGCVNRGLFRETEHKRLAETFRIDPDIVVGLGDVLVSRASGSPALVGSVGKVESLNYQLILSDKTFRPVFRDFICADFMVNAMNSRYYREQVEQAISGAEGLANNLPLSSLRSFQFAIPPLETANAVAASLRKTLSGIDSVITRTQRQVSLLQEYRTRLVADVVTGKLDVREAARCIPGELEADGLAVGDGEFSDGCGLRDSPDLTESGARYVTVTDTLQDETGASS